jgi:hypothetical protein
MKAWRLGEGLQRVRSGLSGTTGSTIDLVGRATSSTVDLVSGTASSTVDLIGSPTSSIERRVNGIVARDCFLRSWEMRARNRFESIAPSPSRTTSSAGSLLSRPTGRTRCLVCGSTGSTQSLIDRIRLLNWRCCSTGTSSVAFRLGLHHLNLPNGEDRRGNE